MAASTTTPAPPPPASQQPYVYFTILEEVFSSSSASASSSKGKGKDTTIPTPTPAESESVMKTEVWEQLPDELQQLVMLRLPAGSQARLSGVCKRWKAVMESAAFREQSAAVAWTSRHAGSRTLIFSGTHAPRFSGAAAMTRVHKVHRVSLATFPTDMPPGLFAGHAQQPQQQHENSKKQQQQVVVLCPNEYQWTAHGGVVAVAVAADAGRALRVCVLDTAAAGAVSPPWRELPRLRPPAACAKTWYHRSWEACLYDAAYDGRRRAWGYKMLVSWVPDEDAAAEVVVGEGEQADGGGGDAGDDNNGNSSSSSSPPPVTSFYVYSSATDAWSATTAAALEDADSRRDPAFLSHLVVGRDCISAKKRGVGWKWRATGKDEEEATTTEFNLRVPSVLPAVLRLPGGMQQGRTWPAVLQDASSSLFCVRSNCTIYKCTGLRWTEVASPPAQMWADMKILTRRRSAQQQQQSSAASAREKGKGFVTDVVLAACIIDPVIFLVVQLPYAACHILGYHVVRDAWEWVAQFHRRPLWHAQWHPPLFVRSPP